MSYISLEVEEIFFQNGLTDLNVLTVEASVKFEKVVISLAVSISHVPNPTQKSVHGNTFCYNCITRTDLSYRNGFNFTPHPALSTLLLTHQSSLH